MSVEVQPEKLIDRNFLAETLGISRADTYRIPDLPQPIINARGRKRWVWSEVLAYIESMKAARKTA